MCFRAICLHLQDQNVQGMDALRLQGRWLVRFIHVRRQKLVRGGRFGEQEMYRDADKSLAQPERKQCNVSVRISWISFGALPCREKNLMTACVLMLLKSRVSLTGFRACFFPGRAKDLSAPRYVRRTCCLHLQSKRCGQNDSQKHLSSPVSLCDVVTH